jgi:sugar phosphate isomerase/epimerase
MPDSAGRRDFMKGSLLAGLGAAAWPAGLEAVPRPFSARPGPRLKLGCAAYSFRTYLDLKNPKMTLEDFMTKCSEWGTDGVELTEYYFKKPVTPEALGRLKRMAVRLGQTITGSPIGNRFTLPPGDARDVQIASVKNWIEVAADLGAPTVRIFAGAAPKGIEPSQARQWAVECIESCLDQAARRGVILALENDGGVTGDADGTLEIVKAIKSDWFGMNLDLGNFQTPDPYVDIERCAPHAVTCHFKTEITRRGMPKEAADLPRLIDILRKANYRGFLNLEHEGTDDPLTAVPKHLETLRSLIG